MDALLNPFGVAAVVFIEEGAQDFWLFFLQGGQAGPAQQELGGQQGVHLIRQQIQGQGKVGLEGTVLLVDQARALIDQMAAVLHQAGQFAGQLGVRFQGVELVPVQAD